MNVLVTGGAGFIGSHVVRKLQKEKINVTVVDNLSTGKIENLPAGTSFVQMDINDVQLEKVFSKGNFDAIVHLAGQITVSTSMKDPSFDCMQNVLGTVHLLEIARKHGVKRIVFSSTAAVYGDVQEEYLPVVESQCLKPMSFYGLSKITAEKYLQLYKESFGLDYVVLRFSNVYGERQVDSGEGVVISIFANCISSDQGITIYGDGNQTRDFIYAGDIANGIYKSLLTKNVNRIYNLSTESEISLNGLIYIFEKITGKNINKEYASPRAGDIYKSILANGRACYQLSWKPEVSLEDGLKVTYEYFCNIHKHMGS